MNRIQVAKAPAPVSEEQELVGFEGGTTTIKPADNLTQTQLEELKNHIAEKTKAYDPKAGEKQESEFDTTEAMGFCELIGKYSTCQSTLILCCGILGSTLFGLTFPAFCLLFANMIDEVGAMSDSTDDIKTQAFYMVYCGLAIWVFAGFQVTMFATFSEKLCYNIRINYFKSCLEQDAAFYDEHSPTEMPAKILKEIAAIQRGTGDKVGMVIVSIVCFISGFGFAFIWGWKLTLILLAAFPAFAIAGGLWTAILETGRAQEMKVYAQSAGYAEQALQAMKVVHTYGNEVLEQNTYSRFLYRSRDYQRSNTFKNAIGGAFIMFLMNLFYGYTLYFGGREIENGQGVPEEDREYTGGALMGIMFCVIIGAFSIGGAGAHVAALTDGKIAGRLAFDVIDHVPKVNPNKQGLLADSQMKGKLEFKDVEFTYPSRQELKVLKKFTMEFEAGKTTALVGPSGSGKSTIIQMIERFYDPDAGVVTLDGTNLKDYDLRSVRQQIGYVSQEPVLFNATIKENMLFAKPDASDADIIEALKDANAWDFIQQKMGSDGINAHVGGSGGKLSGGQKQRIAIARAFLKKPKVLLLDEATSALDKVNEKAIQDAIDRYRKEHGNITIVVIAHRLSTIKDADKIVVMKNGQIVEVGTNDSLLSEFPDGVYATFCAKQEKAEQSVPETDKDETAGADKDGVKRQRTRTVTKMVDGKEVTETEVVAVDEEEIRIATAANKRDEDYDNELKEKKEELEKIGAFSKLMPYNRPFVLVLIAVVGALLNGGIMPTFGVILSQLLAALTIPYEMYDQFFVESEDDSLMYRVEKNVIYLCIVSLASFILTFISKMAFGFLGSNVTTRVRQVLYENVIRKHLGWFDDRENASGIITSAMAQDTSVVNGASSESLGPTVEAAFAMAVGVGLGVYFCWQEAIVCLVASPLLMIGGAMEAQLEKGFSQKTAESMKESNLLVGDAVTNYKTVQSFGHDKVILKMYVDQISPIFSSNLWSHALNGLLYGMGQFGQYLVMAILFYSAGVILDNHKDDLNDDGTPKLDPADVFSALFAMFFAANQAGMAGAFGPDMAKAAAAAERIFRMIETPSQIDAVAIDADPAKTKIPKPEDIRGEIEFKNVWFRYPTRKEDFVLRGLNVKIEPNQKVALIGESGCGKSTFVNLLMRFYEVDEGEILLDGKNIKDYNLHDLRRAISLVMQEPIIFNYSILENILYGRQDASNREVKDASDIANCTEFVEHADFFDFDTSGQALYTAMKNHEHEIKSLIGEEKFKEEMDVMEKVKEQEEAKGEFQGMDGIVDNRGDHLKGQMLSKGFSTQCGIKGGKLSGGQKQRVAIARTIIRKPKVLLLDEATSALDEDNQKLVQDALDKAMDGRTTVIIAHRMSTIQNCEKIFVLEEGKVAEEGGFDELKQKGGYFSKLQQKAQ